MHLLWSGSQANVIQAPSLLGNTTGDVAAMLKCDVMQQNVGHDVRLLWLVNISVYSGFLGAHIMCIEPCWTKCPARFGLSAGHQQKSAGHVRHVRHISRSLGPTSVIFRVTPVVVSEWINGRENTAISQLPIMPQKTITPFWKGILTQDSVKATIIQRNWTQIDTSMRSTFSKYLKVNNTFHWNNYLDVYKCLQPWGMMIGMHAFTFLIQMWRISCPWHCRNRSL